MMLTKTFPIVGIFDGFDVWKGHAKSVHLQVVDHIVPLPINLDVSELKEIYENRDSYIGGLADVQFPFYNDAEQMMFAQVVQIYPNPAYRTPDNVRIDLRDVQTVFQSIG